jgi:hypothetical protein
MFKKSTPLGLLPLTVRLPNLLLQQEFCQTLMESRFRMGKVRNSVRYVTPVFYLRNQRNLA